VKITDLTVTCVLHASVSAKVLLLRHRAPVAEPQSTAVESAARHLMEALRTHTGQLLQPCFCGGASIWSSAASRGPSCCPFSLMSAGGPLPLLQLQGLPAPGEGRGSPSFWGFLPSFQGLTSPGDCISPSAPKEIPCASEIT